MLNTKNMIIIWIWFIVFSNFYSYFYIINTNSLNEVYHYAARPDTIHLTIYVLFVLFIYFLVYLFYQNFPGWKSGPYFSVDDIYAKRRKLVSSIIIIFLLLYIYSILTSGIGLAGGEAIDSSNPLVYFFILLRVDYLAILYVFFTGLNKSNKFILALVLISSLTRGWLGDILLLFLVLIVYKELNFRKLLFSRYTLVFLTLLFSFGFLMQARINYRADGLAGLLEGNYEIEYLLIADYFHDMFIRYQQIYSVAYFFENITYFNSAYEIGVVKPIYFEGVLKSKFYYYFFQGSGDSLGFILADHNRNLLEGRKTAFTSGLIPYIYLSPFSAIYIIIYFFITTFIVTFFREIPVIKFIVFMYIINLFTFGWFNAFSSFLFALICLVFIILFINGFKLRKN